jgi:hypothetical protein
MTSFLVLIVIFICLLIAANAVIVFACLALGDDDGLAKHPDPPARARREIDAAAKLRQDDGT